jgi:hypothetical protein
LAFHLTYKMWIIFLTEDKMKKLLTILALFLLLGFTAEAKPANPPAGFGIFFSTLNPHGQWIELDYGLVVWRPTIIKRGWAPYRIGQWIWTRDGWYWDSYEPFGHVTFHYGRWFYDDYYGWLWVPDYEWAPAWVEWRYDNVHIGWAPLPPYARFSINIGIHFTHTYYTPYHHWHFVTYRYFHEPYVYRHFVGARYKNQIYSRTKYRTNYAYNDGRVVNRGIDIDYVRQRSGKEIRTREIERLRDYSNVERDRNDNTGKVRTLYIPKEELQRERDNSRESLRNNVTRSDRKTSLDISKVEIGERSRGNESVGKTATGRDTRNNADVNRNRTDNNERETRTEIRKTTPPVEERKAEERKVTPQVQERRTEERKVTPQIQERKPEERKVTPPVQERKPEEVRRTESKSNIREMKEVPVNNNRSTRPAEVERRSTNETRNTGTVIEKRQAESNRNATVQPKQEVKKSSETNVQRETRSTERREVQRTDTRNEQKVERNNSSTDRKPAEKNRTR